MLTTMSCDYLIDSHIAGVKLNYAIQYKADVDRAIMPYMNLHIIHSNN